MGCNGGKDGAPAAMSDDTAVMSDATSDERERSQLRRRLLAHLLPNSRPSALNRRQRGLMNIGWALRV